MSYLTDPDKIKQLQYSTAAKMEWNRRVIKEERDAGVHCPTVRFFVLLHLYPVVTRKRRWRYILDEFAPV